jgi:hypothetical protein
MEKWERRRSRLDVRMGDAEVGAYDALVGTLKPIGESSAGVAMALLMGRVLTLRCCYLVAAGAAAGCRGDPWRPLAGLHGS